MCGAEVGDEQRGEDPSVNALQRMVAEMLDQEAAVFLPSGTMCNQIALATHCKPGDVVLLDHTAHPMIAEAGGAAILAGATLYPFDGERGMFTAEQVAQAMPVPSRYQPKVRVVSVEQTTNKPGGRIWPLEQIRAVRDLAHSRGAVIHMDGARLFNASVASKIPVKDYARGLDSVWIDLSKGLGAPVGAVLAGSQTFIDEAWQWKQRIGGAMRQAGIVAAAGIYALQHHLERLVEDHRNAKRLARGIADAPGIRIDPGAVETNIVRFDVAETGVSNREFADRLLAEGGVRVSLIETTALRAVSHLDVTRTDVDVAAQSICNLAHCIKKR